MRNDVIHYADKFKMIVPLARREERMGGEEAVVPGEPKNLIVAPLSEVADFVG